MARSAEQAKQLKYLSFFWAEGDRYTLNLSRTRAPRYAPPFRKGNATLGLLDYLPLEIICRVLEFLDFKSLGMVRRLNTCAQGVVGDLPAYHDMTIYAHGVLRGLAVTNLLGEYCAGDLYSAACHYRCFSCGSFGTFFFLAKGTRCCYNCLINVPDSIAMMSTEKAKLLYGLTDESLKQLTTVPIYQGPDDQGIMISLSSEAKVYYVVNRKDAVDLSAEMTPMQLPPGNMSVEINENFQPDCTWGKSFVFFASTPFPYLDMRRRRVENGLWCHGCQYAHWQSRNRKRCKDRDQLRLALTSYTEDAILEHFENCTSAKLLWKEFIMEGRPLPTYCRPRKRLQ
jgi:hypothetical protein